MRALAMASARYRRLRPALDPMGRTPCRSSSAGRWSRIPQLSQPAGGGAAARGRTRGQLIEQLVDRGWVRRSPCLLVFSNFTVDFNETVMPSCNLKSDYPKHAAFAVGGLARRSSIFDVYASAEFTAWRRSLVTVGDKADPCRTCRQKALEVPALERLGRAVDARLREIGVDVS